MVCFLRGLCFYLVLGFSSLSLYYCFSKNLAVFHFKIFASRALICHRINWILSVLCHKRREGKRSPLCDKCKLCWYHYSFYITYFMLTLLIFQQQKVKCFINKIVILDKSLERAGGAKRTVRSVILGKGQASKWFWVLSECICLVLIKWLGG